MDLPKEQVNHMVQMIQLRYATERSVMDSSGKGEHVDMSKLGEKDLQRYGVKIE